MIYEFGMPVFGWMFWMWILGMVVWIGLLGFIVWIALKYIKGNKSALDIAKKRLAKGEISKEEYEDIKEELK